LIAGFKILNFTGRWKKECISRAFASFAKGRVSHSFFFGSNFSDQYLKKD
jgi:hypothetical protein